VKARIAIILGAWAFLAGTFAALQSFVPSGASISIALAIVASLVVVASGLTSFALKRRQQKETRSAEPDSIETDIARRMQAVAMIDTLVVGCALGAVLLFSPGLPPAVGVFALVVFSVADFWIRFAVATRNRRNEQ
jgi:hypothetical protein